MVSIEMVRKGLLRPHKMVMYARKEILYRFRGVDYNSNGIDIFAEDWDNLIILDACRYDVFADNHTISQGDLSHRESRGAATLEWLRGNFADRDLQDTVYVTGNPQYHNIKDELDTTFHDVWQIWRGDWDEELKTVPPSTLAQRAREAAEKYPHKRLLIHFNQPHGPFLGETAEQNFFGPGNIPMRERNALDDLRIQLKRSQVPHEDWWAAYTETFEIVEDAVKKLLPDLDGRTVISSDHGELLGERCSPIPFKLYNHQIGYYHDALVKVPWFVRDSGGRREIWPGESQQEDSQSVDEQVVTDRLDDLGYLSS